MRRVYFCIMCSSKSSGFDEVTYSFIKLIYHFKTPNYPLIEYQINAVIINRLMRLPSQRRVATIKSQSAKKMKEDRGW